jgi:hypothetical protein
VKHTWQAEYVVSMQMADQDPHLTVRSSFRLKKLTLRSFSAIKE